MKQLTILSPGFRSFRLDLTSATSRARHCGRDGNIGKMCRRFALSACLVLAPISLAERFQCLTEPIRNVQMSVPVAGTVALLHYGEGALVEQGAIILELDTRSERLDMERRTVQVETLKSMLERSETLLVGTSAISLEEVDQARGEYAIASLEYELAKVALQQKQISAPFSGIITHLPVEVGEYAEPPQIALALVDVNEFYAIANIDPRFSYDLKLGGAVRFLHERESKLYSIEGEIVFISPVLDPASGLLRIKAVFPNHDLDVRPGVAGYLEFTTD